MSIQVFPTAPSPTVTHFMNREALILHLSWLQVDWWMNEQTLDIMNEIMKEIKEFRNNDNDIGLFRLLLFLLKKKKRKMKNLWMNEWKKESWEVCWGVETAS